MTPEMLVMALTTNWCAATSSSVMMSAIPALKMDVGFCLFDGQLLDAIGGLRDLGGLIRHEHAEVDEVAAHLA
jgi:hypothetical protein